ncbi:MAG: GNAT family N-acetyltransferase [Myxococcales bacterium]|nr:GNAT family N-acetyltransferase [Myxococcales bacterium]
MSWAVRPATIEELDDLVEFNLAMAEETEGKRLDSAVLRAGIEQGLRNPARARYFVAEGPTGKAVGSLMLTTEWSDWRNGDFWWIQSVYVHPSARRQGIYSALYAEVKRAARTHNDVIGLRLYVETENSAAQETYQALGMTRCHYFLYEEVF